MRQFEVFISSSLKHDEARLKIKEAFELPIEKATQDAEEVKFNVYAHENSGNKAIIARVNSQNLINAVAECHNVFILYIGDAVGDMTIEEFDLALKSDAWNTKFIYVLHNPNDKIGVEGYMPWEEFYSKYMNGGRGAIYYEDQKTFENLREDILSIRQNLIDMAMVPLSPKDIDYSRINYQDEYRLDLPYQERSETDEALQQLLGFKDGRASTPLLLVTGPSLAGKTRSVSEALKRLDPQEFKIHFLRGVSSNTKAVFSHITPEYQFFKGEEKPWHHVLFIDEISRMLFTVDSSGNLVIQEGYKDKFLELCRFANNNPERLTIVGTTADDIATVLTAIGYNSESESWFDKILTLKIPTMRASEMWDLYRKLNSQNRIDKSLTKKIKDGMPIGALFINLTSLKKKYKLLTQSNSDTREARRYCYIFDAIKSIWLWKINRGNQPELLQEYVEKVFGLKIDVYDYLKKVPYLVAIKYTSDFGENYEYHTEQIIVDDVFSFIEGNDNAAYAASVRRIVKFIVENYGDIQYTELFKLVDRLQRRSLTEAAEEAMEEAKKLIGYDNILVAHEYSKSVAGSENDSVDKFISKLMEYSSADASMAIYNKRKTADTLAMALLVARKNGWQDFIDSELLADGVIKEEFLTPASRYLCQSILKCLPYDEALSYFSHLDIDVVTNKTLPYYSYKEFVSNTARTFAQNAVECLMEKVERKSDLDHIIFYLRAKNHKRVEAGAKSWFNDDTELMFNFIRPRSWKTLSDNIMSAHLPEVFDMLNGALIDSECRDKTNLTFSKMHALNRLIDPMNYIDTVKCWHDMGNLRDSFTLVDIIDKTEDYPTARGIIEEFLSGDFARSVRFDQKIANAVLKTANTSADMAECVDLYRLHGSESPWHIDSLAEGRIIDNDPMQLADIDDEYVQGILINKDNAIFSLEQKKDILRRHKNADKVRSPKTIGQIVLHMDFEEAMEMLFAPLPDFITKREQESLSVHPYTLSLIVQKAKKTEQCKRIKEKLKELLLVAKDKGYLHKLLNPSNANILNEYLGNDALTTGVEEMAHVQDEFTAFAGFELANDITPAKYARRFSMSEASRGEKVQYINALIMEHKDMPRKHLKHLIGYRLPFGWDSHTNSINDTGDFPIVGTGGWEIKRCSIIEWITNLLHNRFVDKDTLSAFLNKFIDEIAAETCDREREALKLKFEEIVKLAKENNAAIEAEDLKILRNKLNLCGMRVDLIPITEKYSLAHDLISTKGLKPDEIFEKIRAYESKFGKIYHSASLYIKIALQFQNLTPRPTLSEILSQMRTNGFGDNLFIADVFKQMLHYVSDMDDFESLLAITGELRCVKKFHCAALKAAENCKEHGHTDDAEAIIRYFMFDDNGGLCSISNWTASSILCFMPWTLDEVIDVCRKYGLEFLPMYHHLLAQRLLDEDCDEATEDHIMYVLRNDFKEHVEKIMEPERKGLKICIIRDYAHACRFVYLVLKGGIISGSTIDGSKIIRTLALYSALTLNEIVLLIDKFDLEVDEQSLIYLIMKIDTCSDFDLVMRYKTGPFTSEHGRNLLVRINDYSNKIMRLNLLECLEVNGYMPELKLACVPGTKFHDTCAQVVLNDTNMKSENKIRIRDFCKSLLE